MKQLFSLAIACTSGNFLYSLQFSLSWHKNTRVTVVFRKIEQFLAFSSLSTTCQFWTNSNILQWNLFYSWLGLFEILSTFDLRSKQIPPAFPCHTPAQVLVRYYCFRYERWRNHKHNFFPSPRQIPWVVDESCNLTELLTAIYNGDLARSCRHHNWDGRWTGVWCLKLGVELRKLQM